MKDRKNLPLNGENKMKTMPIGRLLFTMAAPLILSMLVQALYNIVDSIFVSAYDPGSSVAALGLAFPVQNLQLGFALGIAVGVNALLSKSLGEGDREKASHAAGTGIVLALCAAFLFLLFGVFCARPYYAMQSDVASTVENGAAYTAICCIGGIGVFIAILGERLLQATGRTIYTMYTQSTGAIVNIILDGWFIFGGLGLPAMGLMGAAIATVIGQWVSAGLAIFFNLKFNPDISFGLQYLKPKKEILKPILNVGIPSVIMMAIGSVMTFGMNQIFQGFKQYGETATSVFGIYFKLQSFVFMPVFGMNNAAISILAFNFGARQPGRILSTLKITASSALLFMSLGMLAFEFGPELLLNIFNPTPEFLELGVPALRVIAIHFPLAAIGISLGSSFQALGVGVYSTITSLCRQLLVLLPAAWLLSLSGDVFYVWFSFPIAELASLLVTLVLFARIYRKRIKPLGV